MDWKQEVLKRLDALADKLGTTSAYLWSVLMKQAILDGVECIVAAAFFAGIAILCFKLGKWQWSLRRDDSDAKIRSGFSYTGSIAAFAITLAFFVGGIEHFINPAYFALHEILETLGR